MGQTARQTVHAAAIPAELRERPQWVLWRAVSRPGARTDKKPVNPATGELASTIDPATWADFATSWETYQAGSWAGLGYVFAADDPYIGVDLDDCYDRASETLAEWAERTVAQLDSYTEISPSGRGLHAIVRATLPADPTRRGQGRRGQGIELYASGRFFTLTGDLLWWMPATIEARQAQLEALYWSAFGPGTAPATTAPAAPRAPTPLGERLADDEVVARALRAANGAKFARLWRGDSGEFEDDASRADLALCSLLAFWVGADPARIDQLFRQSGLFRPKWERADYRERTISQALNRADYYDDGVRFVANGHGERPPDGDPRAVSSPARFPLTDLGNAERLVARSGSDLRYCDLWSRWLLWDGRRWQADETQGVVGLAKAAVRQISDEVGAIEEPEAPEARKRLARWALASESNARIRAMLDLAESEAGIAVRPDDLDADPWLLAVGNGTLDLRSGELLAPERGRLITKLVPVDYDAAATCPAFLAFLAEILGGDAGLIGFLQRAVGYALTGSIREQVAFLAWGSGANGKSTLFDVLLALLGDYGLQTPTDTLMVRRGEGVPNDVARLRGARFVAAVETEEGRRLSEPLVKQLTGGDRVTARFMRAEWFEFSPTFKLWLATNHKPVIRGTDRAIWRRIRLIPFTVTIPEERQDKELGAKLRAELPGILRWAVEGCLAWQRAGLGAPAAVIEATETYRVEMDVLASWLADCCELGPAYLETAKGLYASYAGWAEQNGERAMSQRTFGLRLAERGFASNRTNHTRLWVGVRRRAVDHDGVPAGDGDAVTHGDAENRTWDGRARLKGL